MAVAKVDTELLMSLTKESKMTSMSILMTTV